MIFQICGGASAEQDPHATCGSCGQLYIIDYAWKDTDIGKFIIVVLNINNDNKIFLKNKELNLQHSGITYSTKKKVIEIFEKYLNKKYNWDGKATSTINIKL